MKVAILGSGPAGLIAMAAIDEVIPQISDVHIYALGQKSKLYGAQYLHEPIPRFTNDNSVEVRYELLGDADGYRRKVYGELSDVVVSPESLGETHNAWDIRQTYDDLWDEFEVYIENTIVMPKNLPGIIKNHDIVISTIPRTRICEDMARHEFYHETIIAAGSAPELGIMLDQYSIPDSTVLCSGLVQDPWYRISNVFEHKTVEFPLRRLGANRSSWPDYIPRSASIVQKPIETSCTCWEDDGIIFAGRYGSWTKGVLAHQVYEQIRETICDRL